VNTNKQAEKEIQSWRKCWYVGFKDKAYLGRVMMEGDANSDIIPFKRVETMTLHILH